jgi:hypothetical protein
MYDGAGATVHVCLLFHVFIVIFHFFVRQLKMSLFRKSILWQPIKVSVQYLIAVLFLLFINVSGPKAQGAFFWSEQKRIPDYPDFTQEPPYLIADQNNTIHAFNAQVLQPDEENSPKAIFYRQWTREGGWTSPNDIIYDRGGGTVDILGVVSDSSGTVYLLFQKDFHDIYLTVTHLADAGKSTDWSSPILLASQSTHVGIGFEIIGAIATDDNGNLVVIYSGSEVGKGLYSVSSSDYGSNWSDPYPVYLTGDDTVVVTDPALYVGRSGLFHAVWSTFLNNGSGGPGYYGQYDPGTRTWTEPIPLDLPGIRTPDVIEYEDQIIVSYYHRNVNGNWWRISGDGGKSWSIPSQVSTHHVGTNGRVSFVVDSQNNLYAFFGERINDLNHGMWQSRWTGYTWTEPEPVVRGPQIRDVIGGDGFDPRAARAIVSNGNLILVTWTTDGFAGENGVWYSVKQVDAPALPSVALQEPTNIPPATITVSAPSTAVQVAATATRAFDKNDDTPGSALNPQLSIIIGVVPVLLVLLGTIFIFSFRHNKNK